MRSQQDTGEYAPTGVHRPAEEARVLEHVETTGIRFLHLEFTDVVGLAKSVTIPAEQLQDVFKRGKWFDGSAIEGFARVAETDMYLRPDLSTFAEVPWRAVNGSQDPQDTRLARIICDVLVPSGERFEGDSRGVLIATLEQAARLGYRYEVSPELEFFILRESPATDHEPLGNDRSGYFDHATDASEDLEREIVSELTRMGIAIESSHHEGAAGQHELDFVPTDALRAADAIFTARDAIKAIAQQHGLVATFLPKPFYRVNGSGMHIHQRLVHVSDGSNAFGDPSDEQYGLSQLARQFIAGQLTHAQGMCAVVAPLVNSYKRLVPGYDAPVMIYWGRINREALIRVPRVAAGTTSDVRVELRSPDPSCNPYLALAVMLRAGLDGIARELPLAPPVEEGLYTLDESARRRRGIELLPATLGEALEALQADDEVLDTLGQQIGVWFVEAKQQEWSEYRRQVHPWEIERYFPAF